MKINNQHLEALRQVQEQSSKTGAAKSAGVEDFAKALAQELGAAGVGLVAGDVGAEHAARSSCGDRGVTPPP